MTIYFADTSLFVAFLNARDEFHDVALQLAALWILTAWLLRRWDVRKG